MNKEKQDIFEEYNNMEDFWPFYLNEHRNPTNRYLHFIGSSLGLVFLFLALIKKKPSFLLYGLISGYAFAWIGHFFIEKNKQASFKSPFKSFLSDWRMFGAIATGNINNEMLKAEIYDHLNKE